MNESIKLMILLRQRKCPRYVLSRDGRVNYIRENFALCMLVCSYSLDIDYSCVIWKVAYR